MTLKLPSWATVALGLTAGALSVINQLLVPGPWTSVIAALLVLIAGLGISPTVGPAFRSALHLAPWLSTLLSTILAGLAVVLTTTTIAPVHDVLVSVITAAAALGFAPAVPWAVAKRSLRREDHRRVHPAAELLVGPEPANSDNFWTLKRILLAPFSIFELLRVFWHWLHTPVDDTL